MQRWMRAAGLFLAAGLALRGQAPADTCRIEGTVYNAVTGQPVRKAKVTLITNKNDEPTRVVTDVQGRYVVARIPPGTYRLAAVRDGYMGERYGAKKATDEGEALELTAGTVRTKVDFRLTPLGAILGHVRDEDGDPVRMVTISVLAYGYGPSGKKLQMRGSAQTDPSGEYKVFDLVPGTYYVRARPMSDQMPGMARLGEVYATTYFPNAAQASGAAAIELAAGQEQRDTDFTLHPVAVASIRGRVIKPVGAESCTATLEGGFEDEMPSGESFAVMGGVVGGVLGTVMTTDPSSAAEGTMPDGSFFFGGSPVDQDGKFAFRNVPIGSHTVSGICNVGKREFSVKVPVQLDTGGLDGLELRPLPPSLVQGRIRIDGESQAKLTEAVVSLGPGGPESGIFVGGDNDNTPDGNVQQDGTFVFRDLAPEVYHLGIRMPPGLYLQSVTQEGRDVSASGIDVTAGDTTAKLEIVLSANGGSIEGSVTNGQGATVTLIPADPQRARTLSASVLAGSEGHFSFAALAPGSYRLLAWENVDVNAALYDSEFRKPYEGKGQTVEVAEKQKSTVQLELIPKIGK